MIQRFLALSNASNLACVNPHRIQFVRVRTFESLRRADMPTTALAPWIRKFLAKKGCIHDGHNPANQGP